MSKIALRVLTEDEMAESDRYWRAAGVAHAWHLWELASCIERGGHWWYLDISPWGDGAYLACTGCGADVDDIYPDGYDLMGGDFYVSPNYTLSLDCGDVLVNGVRVDEDLLIFGWRGPVTAELRVEKYGGHITPVEYDVFIDLEAV